MLAEGSRGGNIEFYAECMLDYWLTVDLLAKLFYWVPFAQTTYLALLPKSI